MRQGAFIRTGVFIRMNTVLSRFILNDSEQDTTSDTIPSHRTSLLTDAIAGWIANVHVKGIVAFKHLKTPKNKTTMILTSITDL